LVDPAFGEKRDLLAYRPDGALCRDRDAQGYTTHFPQTHDYALFCVGFHDALDHLAGMIRGAILKKCHDYSTKTAVQTFKVGNRGSFLP
jgi:hypothetical protein